MVDIQRLRLLAAAARTVAERGYADATVAHITRHARVSRRTFYDLFANREECLAAMLEDVATGIAAEVDAAVADAAARRGVDVAGLIWRERVRAGLEAILVFLDREPALAQVCVVQSARGGPLVLAWRGEVLARLTAVLDEGRGRTAPGGGAALTAEGLVGAAHAIVYARLLRGEARPLTGLLGELMGMIVLPYQGPAAARREQARRSSSRRRRAAKPGSAGGGGDPLVGVKMRLTYRTARVLLCVARHPGASNREISDHAGIADAGQISKLLRRLQRIGLLENLGEGGARGMPNQWQLTAKGAQIAQHIDSYSSEAPSGGAATQTNTHNLREGR